MQYYGGITNKFFDQKVRIYRVRKITHSMISVIYRRANIGTSVKNSEKVIIYSDSASEVLGSIQTIILSSLISQFHFSSSPYLSPNILVIDIGIVVLRDSSVLFALPIFVSNVIVITFPIYFVIFKFTRSVII